MKTEYMTMGSEDQLRKVLASNSNNASSNNLSKALERQEGEAIHSIRVTSRKALGKNPPISSIPVTGMNQHKSHKKQFQYLSFKKVNL